MEIESERERRRVIGEGIHNATLSREIMDALLPKARALPIETELWDYKRTLLDHHKYKGSDEERTALQLEQAELVKDCVAMYNSYGGYIVCGVDDRTREILGVNGTFDTDEFKSQIRAFSGARIDISIRDFSITAHTQHVKVTFLHIPKRPYTEQVVQFKKDAPANHKNQRAFKKGDFYLRRDSQTRPIQDQDDLSFLTGSRTRETQQDVLDLIRSPLENNLPMRDPGLIDFIGRKDYISNLKKWLIDNFANLRILTGLGGLGKTAIARVFAEDVIMTHPEQLQMLIWLGAKRQFFLSLSGRNQSVSRVDFYDARSCFQALLLTLGYNESEVADLQLDDLRDLARQGLEQFPALVIVDDVDSLAINEQVELVSELQRLAHLNQDTALRRSKILITSRLSLGVGYSEELAVKGLNLGECGNYLDVVTEAVGVSRALFSADITKRLHEVSDGSPTFINAIVRLVALGDSPLDAITAWKDKEGEDVRLFAFGRELENLKPNTSAVLYIACILQSPTQNAIREIAELSPSSMRDCVLELRKFHMLSKQSDQSEFLSIEVPESLRVMVDILRSKVVKAQQYERRALALNSEVKSIGGKRSEIDVVVEVASKWKSNQPKEALIIAQDALERAKDSPVILSMVARSLLKIVPPDPRQADSYFKQAVQNGNKRIETITDWILCKKMLKDWSGLAGVADRFRKELGSANAGYFSVLAAAHIANNRRLERKVSEAADKYKFAGDMAKKLLDSGAVTGRGMELIELKKTCYENHVTLTDQLYGSSDEAYRVWDSVMDALGGQVTLLPLVNLGVQRLEEWFTRMGKTTITDITLDRMRYSMTRVRTCMDTQAVPQSVQIKLGQLCTNLDPMLRRYEHEHKKPS